MGSETFYIKSLYIQNTIMLFFMGVVVSLLVHSVFRKKLKRVIVFCLWVILVVWFFNSPFFGFSAVSVSPAGIKLNYGVLSFRNDMLALESEWKIESYMAGIRRNRRLYFISIGGRESMRVRGVKERQGLERIGERIDRERDLRAVESSLYRPVRRRAENSHKRPVHLLRAMNPFSEFG
jgi:hypothetical protein